MKLCFHKKIEKQQIKIEDFIMICEKFIRCVWVTHLHLWNGIVIVREVSFQSFWSEKHRMKI